MLEKLFALEQARGLSAGEMALETAEESEHCEKFSFTASRTSGTSLQGEKIIRKGRGEKNGTKGEEKKKRKKKEKEKN